MLPCSQRVFIFAARSGFQLPLPPPPRYHLHSRPPAVLGFGVREESLLPLESWAPLWMQSKASRESFPPLLSHLQLTLACA